MKKKSRYNEEQIIGFLRQADAGMPVKEPCHKGGSIVAKCGDSFYIAGRSRE